MNRPCHAVLALVLWATATKVDAIEGVRVPLGVYAPGSPDGFVTVPGTPLPAVPADSVRSAIAFYEPTLALLRLAGDSPSTANGLRYLATLYGTVGRYETAERLFGEAQRILEKYPPGEILASVHNDRGFMLIQEEKQSLSLRSFHTALAILDPRREEFLEGRIAVLGNLATAYTLLGDAEKAEEAYLGALQLLRRRGGEDSDAGHNVRFNLSILYGSIGDYAAARKILEGLLMSKVLGPKLRFAARSQLGHMLAGLKQFPEAISRLKEAQAMTVESTPERNQAVLNLASVYGWSGDYVRMEDLAHEGLRLSQHLYGMDSRLAAVPMLQLAVIAISRNDIGGADRLITRAMTILAKNRGDEECYVFAMRELALVAQLKGEDARAKGLSRRALDLSKKELQQILAFGSESQRLAFRSRAFPYDQLANLGDPTLLADAVLNMKGVVLDSLVEERALVRRSKSPRDREELDRINELKLEILQRISRGENIDEPSRRLKESETALAKRLAPRALMSQEQLTLASVQRRLRASEVLIELLQYQHLEQRATTKPWYGALIIPHEGVPSWVPLGPSADINETIQSLVAAFNRRAPGRGVVSPLRPDEVTPLLRQLNDVLWEPLSQKLPKGTRSVLLSPDDATAFLPWAALVNQNGAFLAERIAVMQLGSARDAFNDVTPPSTKTFVAFGRPSAQLPTLADEVREIASEAKQHGWHTTAFLGTSASERQLIKHARPGILHLATHGGYLGRADATRFASYPMYRGYVLLDGGEETLQTWVGGASTSSPLDGVLTAEEASALDLTGTWLTVLSACETGTGDARTGEGVMGLRRGFLMAGTKHLLFTLWRVKDEPTTQFMQAFYKRLFQTNDPVLAFQTAQKAELLRWKKETGNAGDAAYRAGGFVLTR